MVGYPNVVAKYWKSVRDMMSSSCLHRSISVGISAAIYESAAIVSSAQPFFLSAQPLFSSVQPLSCYCWSN